MLSPSTLSADRYLLHRTALAPLLPGAGHGELERACSVVAALKGTAFAEFICQQGLAPLWDKCAGEYPGGLGLADDFLARIHRARLQATAYYLGQRRGLAQAREILEAQGVTHVVIKGAHTRELYYDEPALRPATDIDILIRPQDRIRAIEAFRANGFEFRGTPQNISQDCSLVKGETDIDLHWDILRPGRTRRPIVEDLLERRRDHGSHWGMDHPATLFLMLVHPVFRKYSTTAHATLVRMVDLMLLVARNPEAITGAERLLGIVGLRTAGWITIQWLRLLTDDKVSIPMGDPPPAGKLRQKWLRLWLAADGSSRLLAAPLLIHLGLTLPAHDTWQDLARATRQARRCKAEAGHTLEILEQRLSQGYNPATGGEAGRPTSFPHVDHHHHTRME